MKGQWKIIANKLKKAGWSCDCIVSMDSQMRDIFVVAAQRSGMRFIVHADEELSAFLELESAIRDWESAT